MSPTHLESLATDWSLIDKAAAEIGSLADRIAAGVERGDFIGALAALEGLGVCRFFLHEELTSLLGANRTSAPSGSNDTDTCGPLQNLGLYL